MNRRSEDATSAGAASEPQQPVTNGAGVLVVLCTYNEVQNLPLMVEQLHRELPAADVLVVDDNSPDGTGRWVQEAMGLDSKLHLLQRPGKLGLGTALRSGIEWCLERNYACLLNLDADLSHPTNKARQMVATCLKADCDVAIGSRYIAGGGLSGLPWHRRIISRLLNGLATRLLKLPLTDCSGSYRCYRTAALGRVDFNQLTCTGYGFLEELLVHLHRRGARFVEVPIVFEERSSGRSKLSLHDAVGALGVIFRLRSRNSD